MNLFSFGENGAMRKVSKIDFNEKKVFLIDNFKTLYLWYGEKASTKKKDLSLRKVEKLKETRKESTSLQILNQNHEHGSFLAIKDILKKGLTSATNIEKRHELKIKFEDTIDLLEAGIDPDFEAEITIAAHNLSQEKWSYEDLCHKLAELQLIFLKGESKLIKKDIEKKAKEIYSSSSTYDELCWLIAQMRKLLEKA